MKKLIGLTGPSSFSEECKKLIENYLNQNVVFLLHNNEDNLNYWLNKCDAFILAGGVDIHPTVYETDLQSNQSLSKFDLLRDFRELRVVEYAIESKKPMLGICRGHQLIGIYKGLKNSFCLDLGGSATIHQPIKAGISVNQLEPIHSIEIINSDIFSETKSSERDPLSRILAENSKNKFWVNSFHHQGFYYNPKGNCYKENDIEVIAIASAEKGNKNNKIIEMMRGESWISVQWHPEWDYEVNTPSKVVTNYFKRMVENN